eukprot:259623-Rhodomonas_salina.1
MASAEVQHTPTSSNSNHTSSNSNHTPSTSSCTSARRLTADAILRSAPAIASWSPLCRSFRGTDTSSNGTFGSNIGLVNTRSRANVSANAVAASTFCVKMPPRSTASRKTEHAAWIERRLCSDRSRSSAREATSASTQRVHPPLTSKSMPD